MVVDDLRALIESERQRFAVPGCAVLVVADGEVLLAEGFGRRDIDRDLPVTAQTLFPIGSSTKTFTAALCGVLVAEGRLDWDRPARDYLPDLRMADGVATDQLTVYDMLCHRSGLPRHDLLWYVGRDELSRDDLLAALRHLEPSAAFRQTWQYNNILYTVAGMVAGAVAGTSYEEATSDLILDPLGMTRTNFSVRVTERDADAARPYVGTPGSDDVTEVPFAQLDLIAPAGAINSCLADLTPWLLTLLGRGVGDGDPLLPDSVLSRLISPAMPLPEGSLLSVGRPVGYGLGVVLEDYRGHRVVHHGGNIDGFSSQVSLVPEAGCGVVVLTNRDGTALRDALPATIYDRILRLAPGDLGGELLARQNALHQARIGAGARMTSIGLGPVRPVSDYVGRYRHPGYGDLHVSADTHGSLVGRYRSVEAPLEHRHLEVFTFATELGGEPHPIPVQFQHDLDGEVTAALMAIEPTVDPVRFDRVPDTAHLTAEVLDRLTGTYRLGPLEARVDRRGPDGLAARIVEGGFVPLTPVRDLVFRFKRSRIEFTEDGRLQTPYGTFEPAADRPPAPSPDQPPA